MEKKRDKLCGKEIFKHNEGSYNYISKVICTGI